MASSVPTLEDQPDAEPAPEGRRLRVLHVINLDEAGGAERFAMGLASHLPADRFDCWMCCPRGGDAEALAVMREAQIPVVDLGRRRKWQVHRLVGLVRLLREHRFDIVHTHMFGSNLWGTLIATLCRVPVVIAHEQTWSYEGNPLRVWIDGHVIGRLASRFVAVSTADAERMIRIEHVPPEKVVFIPNAYVPRLSPVPSDLRGELELGPDIPLYGTVAVLRPQKALHVLVEAHAHVLRRLPNAHLVVAGSGECQDALTRQAQQLGIASQTHFLGVRQDVEEILQALDLAAMSSDFEGTPLFACECMAAGTPLVATDVGGLPDLITDGENGVLVPRRDPAALAEAITELLQNPARRHRLADVAAQRLEQFTIGAITNRFVDLYESMVSEHAAAKVRSA